VESFADWLGGLPRTSNSLRVMLSPGAALRLRDLPTPVDVLLLAGPEGGLDPEEQDLAGTCGISSGSPGPTHPAHGDCSIGGSCGDACALGGLLRRKPYGAQTFRRIDAKARRRKRHQSTHVIKQAVYAGCHPRHLVLVSYSFAPSRLCVESVHSSVFATNGNCSKWTFAIAPSS
jgi:hypothetical protein